MAKRTRVTRTLRLSSATIPSAHGLLAAVEGVDSVIQAGPERLRVTYDVTNTGWSALCERLKAVQAYAPEGRFARWRDRWRNFREQSMRNKSRRSQSSCCG